MKREVVVRLHASCEELVQTDSDGGEFWLARDLQLPLGYARWENFDGVVRRATQLIRSGSANGNVTVCERSVALGSSAIRNVVDYRCDRPAVELLALLTSSFKLNGYFLTRNESVLLGLLAKWARSKGFAAEQQYQVGRFRFDLMLADTVLVEFDEPHHESSRQRKVDQEKSAVARTAGFELVRLGLLVDVVDAILLVEPLLQRNIAEANEEMELLSQSHRAAAAGKSFANEITNFNIKRDGLADEAAISSEHVKNNRDVRELLGKRGIRPEALPVAEDIKKGERRVHAETKKLPKPPKRS